MIFPLFRRRPHKASIDRLYGEIMAVTRDPAFYLAPFAIDDTFEGRFELMVYLAGFPLRRLAASPDPGPALAQELSDCLFSHIDDALREMGVSDVGVPKRMNKLAGAFMGRGAAYAAALEAGEGELVQAVERNIYNGAARGAALARYGLAAQQAFATAPLSAFIEGPAPFPVP